MVDQYDCFKKLERGEKSGIDYDIQIKTRNSPVAIVAPHGGEIEPHTTTISAEIAGDSYNFYSFLGLKPNRPHGELHITSAKFDEPDCLRLISSCDIVVAIHGRADNGDPKTIYLGGLDVPLRDRISEMLFNEKFAARTGQHQFPGTHTSNICNRGRQNRGVQLEMPRTLRNLLQADRPQLSKFADAMRKAIGE